MREVTFKIYSINEHPNPEACYDYARNNWHDLGQHYIDEMIDSLKELAAVIHGELDYSISIVPDRGEFVIIKDYDSVELDKLMKVKDECPLTGHCYDIDVIEGLFNGELEHTVLKTLHDEGDYIYSDEGLKDMFEANEYEFYENGKIA